MTDLSRWGYDDPKFGPFPKKTMERSGPVLTAP